MAGNVRPKQLQNVRSFTRMESGSAKEVQRKRASTLSETGIPAIPEARRIETSPDRLGKRHVADIFENGDDHDEHEHDKASGQESPAAGPESKVHIPLDELPIEIRSLTERFLESLSAKVHPTPLNAEHLSEMFQAFYERASAHISTHIASLASRIGRDKSAERNLRNTSKGRPRAESSRKGSSEDLLGSAGGEMLTPTEVADRRKARKLLELKRIALEEAVERCVCEKVYDRIWKHRSTDDDARDEKLRSRTAALAVVGIGLKELYTDHDPAKADIKRIAEEKEDDINRSLAPAREALLQMDDQHYPLGKLRLLTAAHKSIVETLSQLFPSSSSADEILPTLIYTLINMPPEGIRVVSHLNFVQRFRAASKVDGEAAYCLVNLEAAIAFLETVDLSSLRADEVPEGPPKQPSRPETPTSESSNNLLKPTLSRTLTPGVSAITVGQSDQSSSTTSAAKTLSSSPAPNASARPTVQARRLSSLMQAQADRIEAGRDNLLQAADKVYESVNSTLDTSVKYLFGRFTEQVASPNAKLPLTLEEARKLVDHSSVTEDDEDLSVSGRSSPAAPDDPLNSLTTKPDTKMLELIGGRKGQLRDRSVDSTTSAGSSGTNSKRVSFMAADGANLSKMRDDRPAAPATATAAPAGNAGTLFASINPLNRLSGVTGLAARFTRVGTAAPATPSPWILGEQRNGKTSDTVESHVSLQADGVAAPVSTSTVDVPGDELNARESLAALRQIKPPKRRFLEVQSASDLRLGEVEELLLEYRRLAKSIANAVAD